MTLTRSKLWLPVDSWPSDTRVKDSNEFCIYEQLPFVTEKAVILFQSICRSMIFIQFNAEGKMQLFLANESEKNVSFISTFDEGSLCVKLKIVFFVGESGN